MSSGQLSASLSDMPSSSSRSVECAFWESSAKSARGLSTMLAMTSTSPSSAEKLTESPKARSTAKDGCRGPRLHTINLSPFTSQKNLADLDPLARQTPLSSRIWASGALKLQGAFFEIFLDQNIPCVYMH